MDADGSICQGRPPMRSTFVCSMSLSMQRREYMEVSYMFFYLERLGILLVPKGPPTNTCSEYCDSQLAKLN